MYKVQILSYLDSKTHTRLRTRQLGNAQGSINFEISSSNQEQAAGTRNNHTQQYTRHYRCPLTPSLKIMATQKEKSPKNTAQQAADHQVQAKIPPLSRPSVLIPPLHQVLPSQHNRRPSERNALLPKTSLPTTEPLSKMSPPRPKQLASPKPTTSCSTKPYRTTKQNLLSFFQNLLLLSNTENKRNRMNRGGCRGSQGQVNKWFPRYSREDYSACRDRRRR